MEVKKMSKIRYYLAYALGNLSEVMLKLIHKKIPYYKGYIALKIDHDFLKHVKKPKLVIAVTGTNGKSTICDLLKKALEYNHMTVINNNGFNIDTGIASMFLSMKRHTDVAIIEVDEKLSGEIFKSVPPDYLICTNLFRDSMKTNSTILNVATLIKEGIPKSTKRILNGDDLIVVNNLGNQNSIYFSIDTLIKSREHLFRDLIYCPLCNTKLDVINLKYYHVGKMKCPKCGFTNPLPKYRANIDKDLIINNTYSIKDYDGSIFNAYNYLAIVSLLNEIGISTNDINESLNNIKLVDSRFSKTIINNKTLITHLAKGQNPVAVSSTLEYITNNKEDKTVLLMLDDVLDNRLSSETVAWYYDTDFEYLNDSSIKRIIIGGKRCNDLYVRLLLAGINKDKIIYEDNISNMPKDIDYKNTNLIYLLHDLTLYDQSLEIKQMIMENLHD